MKNIIAIIDTLTQEIQGPLMVMAQADAAAVRWFNDVANHPESSVQRHIEDYILKCLGTIDENHNVTPESRIIITGEQWKAAQLPQEG
jgi:hypothetical protein